MAGRRNILGSSIFIQQVNFLRIYKYSTKNNIKFYKIIKRRLKRISEESSVQQMPRRRSNSLPIPKIEVSIYQSPESKKKEDEKEFIDIPDTKDTTAASGKNYLSTEK